MADLQYDQTRLLATLDHYMEQVLCFRDEYLTEFHSSPAFETVFGNIPMGPVSAVTCANIDTALDNILEQVGQLYCIDYEWTFEKTLKEKELLEKETELLQSKLAKTEAKLSRHLSNETRLRNVIQKLKTQ